MNRRDLTWPRRPRRGSRLCSICWCEVRPNALPRAARNALAPMTGDLITQRLGSRRVSDGGNRNRNVGEHNRALDVDAEEVRW